MTAVYEAQAPLYTIKYYNEHLYRVVKRLFDAHRPISLCDRSQKEDRLTKFDSSLSRAKNTVREIALCNEWEYFVTLTFDKNKWDRYDLKVRVKELMQWLQNLNKQNKRIRYLLVPEFHEDGAVHFHGLMSGIEAKARPEWWPRSVNRKADGSYYDHWAEYSSRYGFNSIEPVRDMVAVGFYVSKYITKSLAEKADFKGVHTYYRSHGLSRAVEIGSTYATSSVLDKACKFSNSFYSFGFFKCDEFVDAVSLCDEVEKMFSSYIISDPVSGEIVAITGGDSEDKEVQMMLAAFEVDGYSIDAIPLEDASA